MTSDPFALDAELADRFARRVDVFLRISAALIALCFLFQLIYAPTLSLFPHLLSAGLAFIALRVTRDPVNRLVFSGTTISLAGMLILNATVNVQSIDFGLVNPLRAATIALVSQAGVTLIAVIDSLVPRHERSIQTAGARVTRLMGLANVLFALVVGGMMLDLVGALPPIISESLRFLVPLPLALRYLTRPPSLRDPWLCILLTLSVITAVRTNARSDLLTLGLLLTFLYVIHADRVFSLTKLLAAWVLVQFVGVFSAVSLAVRPLRDNPPAMMAEFRDRILSPETLVAVLNPFHEHSANLAFQQRQTDTIYFSSDFFRGAPASLFDRLTLLPQMDIVTGLLPAPNGMNFGVWLQGTLWSASPNFGQTKLNMLGDQLVWDLALRSRDSIGRPMITAQAEAWSMGGYLAVFLTAILVFGAWAINWRLLSRQIVLRSVLIPMAAMFMVYALFSTTLTSQTLSLLRMPFQTMAILAVLLWVAKLFPLQRVRFSQTLSRHTAGD